MKYVITGAAGHISQPIVEGLLNAGHTVTVIGRDKNKLQHLVDKGAIARIGSVEDQSFLNSAFAGADAVYTMAPPNYASNNVKEYIQQVVEKYAKALAVNNVPYVVNLSSIGAHLPEGCGPVTALHYGEIALNALTTTKVLHLRPSYFYYNLLANIGLIKQAGIMGSNFALPSGKFAIADTTDIAAVALEKLLQLDFTHGSVRNIASDETSTDEIAEVLGNAIGKPDLKWVKFSDDQALAGMIQAGLTEDLARNYVEMGQALDSGKMLEDYFAKPSVLGKVKLQDFSKVFAAAFNS